MHFLLKGSRIFYNIVLVQKSPMTIKKQSKNIRYYYERKLLSQEVTSAKSICRGGEGGREQREM